MHTNTVTASKAGQQYWINKIEGANHWLTAYPQASGGYAYITFPLPSALVNAVHKLGSADALTELAVYLSFYGVLLRKYFSATQLLIASTTPEIHDESERVAFFSLEIDQEKTVKQLLLDAKGDVEEVLHYQENSFGEISGLLASNNIALEPALAFAFTIADHQQAACFDSRLAIRINKAARSFEIKYDTGMFTERLAGQIAQSYILLLEQGLADPLQKCSALEFLSRERLAEVLVAAGYPGTIYDTGNTIVSQFERIVAAYPFNVAVSMDGTAVTYQELDQHASRIAQLLIQQQVQPGAFVGLLLNRSVWTIAAILGVLKAGAAYVPLNPDDPEDRRRFILDDARITLVLTDNDLRQAIPAGISVIVVPEALEVTGTATVQRTGVSVAPGDICYVIYTSGTTGRPKGVMVRHANVVQLFFNEGFPFDFDQHDSWTLFHNYNFDFSVWEIFGALFYGGKIVIVPQNVFYNTGEFIRLLSKEQVTVLNQTPGVFSLLMNAVLEMPVLPKLFLRYVIFGGEELKPWSLGPWARAYPHIQLINMYGITETTVHVTFKRLLENDIAGSVSNIGKPLFPVQLYILNDDKQLLPEGIPGEIYVGGAGVSAGYLNNDALTRERFIQFAQGGTLYRSGDIGKKLENGDVVYLGRKDNQVSIRGYRVEIGEIEAAFVKHPAVKDVLVIATANQFSQTELVAFLLLKEAVSPEAVKEFVSDLLPRYMLPVRLHVIAEKPLTRNGKIDTVSLLETDRQAREQRVSLEPVNIVEEELLAIWKKLLKTGSISVQDDFFAIGGDSIKVIKLLNQVNQHISRLVEIEDLFEYKTIRSLADYVIRTDKESGNNILRGQVELKLRKLKAEILESQAASSLLPAGVEDIYPMSDIEKGMIFHNLYYGNAGVYHDQFIYQFREVDFDVTVFGKALNYMIEKHELLRASFYIDAFAESVQVVHAPQTCFDRMVFEDISHYDREGQRQHIDAFMKQDRQRCFEITAPGLWRMVIFKLGEDQYLLLWIFHHAILDGWSNASFITELINNYARIRQDSSYRPPALALSYKDHVIDQIMAKNDTGLQQYWKQYLEGYKRVPLPFKSREMLNFNKAESRVTYCYIEGEKASRIRDFALRSQMSLKELLFAGFLYLLRIACDQEDITIGLVSHNRPAKKDGDRLLGCFLNTVPFRISIPHPDIDVSDFIGEVRAQYQLSKQHDRLPFMEIVKGLGEKGGYVNPVFDVKFDFVDFHVYGDVTEHAQASRNRNLLHTYTRTNTAFDFNTGIARDAIMVTITCPEKSYTEAEITFIHDLYTAILLSFATNEHINYRELMNDVGAWSLIDQVNGDASGENQDGTWLNMFEEQVKKTPDQTAVVFEGNSITYRGLNEQADRLAHYINSKVAAGNARVAIILPRSDLFVVSMLAVLKAGLTFVPLDTSFPEDRMKYILEDAAVALILTDYSGWLQLSGPYREKVMAVDIQLPVLPSQETGLPVIVKGDDQAYMIYTSGSTGQPKGVPVKHAAVRNYITWFIETYNITDRDRTLVFSSLAFDLSYTTLLSSLVTGAALHLFPSYEKLDLDRWRNYLIDHEITYLKLTPSHFSMLIADHHFPDWYQPVKIRLFVTGGEKLRPRDIKTYLEHFPHTQFLNHYGPTETTIGVITYDINADNVGYLFHNPVIGRPIRNHQVYICNEQMEMAGPGQKGEICIGGTGVAQGYHNREMLTRQKFIMLPSYPGRTVYRTGDIGKWLPNGLIEFHGRLDDQVKINGYRVEPGEIEAYLRAIAGIEKAKVIAVENNTGGNELIAFLLTNGAVPENVVKEKLAKVLPDYMLPHSYRVVDSFPLTANGKVDKALLLAMSPVPLTADIVPEPLPMNEIELKVHEIWKKVLGIEVIHPDSKFFDVGGDSLRLVHLAKRLAEDMSSRLEVADLFNYTSIREIARQLQVDQESPVIKGIEI